MAEPGSRRIADRYALASEIGAGGMGVVWRARDERLGRDVALKVLAAGAVGNELARARLIREARAAGQLQHEGIVHVYDVGETDDGGAFLVMELVSGRTLRELLEEGSLELDERVDIVVAIAEALGYAHDAGIVHRDVKPDNVLVRKNGRPVVLDFGLAKPIPAGLADTIDTADSAKLTKDGHIVGTPAYLAPEQLRGLTVGPAADQFALGVTAFELLTGRLPWKGEAVLEVLASMLSDAPARASSIRSDLPEAASDVLDRAMQKDPKERYPSIGDFSEALAAAFGLARPSGPSRPSRVSGRSTPPAPLRRPGTDSDVVSISGMDRTVEASKTSRRGWLGIAAVLAVAGGGAVLVARSATGGSDATEDAGIAAQRLGEDAVVACPVFDVSTEEAAEPHGWLGAAAASLACDRARMMLGGRAARALPPAELLPGIPREPADDTIPDPFSRPEARPKTIAAARERGDATIEGKVTKASKDFVVSLAVRAKDGRELARGEGRGFELFVAVSNAMKDARGAFGMTEPSAFQRTWLRVGSIDAALDLLDVTTAVLTEDDVETKVACERVAARSDVAADMAYLVRAVCTERLERKPLDGEPPAIDDSSPAALTTTVAAHRTRGGPEATAARMARLVPVLEKTSDPDERVIVAATIAELAYNAGDLSRSQSYARMALQSSPKLVDIRGTPWHRLAFASQFDASITWPHAAWIAWEPVAVQNAGTHDAPITARTERSGRGYLLARRGYFATAYGENLAHLGKVEQARSIAEQVNSDFLRVRVFIAQALFKKAVAHGLAAIARLPDDDAGAGQAYRLLGAITEASRYIGAKPAFTDEVLARYLFTDPPRLKVGVVPFVALVYACADAPAATAKRCIARIREAYAHGVAGAVLGAAPALLDGADRWAAGDAKGAATAWRPMLREAGAFVDEAFRHVMADAFSRAGEDELAVQVDAEWIAIADEPSAMDLAFVREAFRAEKKGDHARARKLAEKCLAALRYADEEVAMTKDLKALLERLPPP